MATRLDLSSIQFLISATRELEPKAFVVVMIWTNIDQTLFDFVCHPLKHFKCDIAGRMTSIKGSHIENIDENNENKGLFIFFFSNKYDCETFILFKEKVSCKK